MGKLLLCTAIFFLNACGPTSGTISAQVVSPLNESMNAYGLKVVELKNIVDVRTLEGKEFEFAAGFNMPWVLYEETLGASTSFEEARRDLFSRISIRAVDLNLTWNGVYYCASDFDSLYMLSAYHLFELALDFYKNVVGDESTATRTPVKIGVYGSFTTSGIFKIPSSYLDNSAYLPLADVFKIYRVAEQEGLPFGMNPGVIAHEFHHRIFHKIVFERNANAGFEIFKSLSLREDSLRISRTRNLLRGIDEGLADIHAVGFTGDTNFLALSTIVGESKESDELRSLEGAFANEATYENLADSTISRKFVRLCGGNSLNYANPKWRFYCLGTLIARTLWDASERKVEVLRQDVLPALNRSLVGLGEKILQPRSIEMIRHCERSEAIQIFDSTKNTGLPRCARNDENQSLQPTMAVMKDSEFGLESFWDVVVAQLEDSRAKKLCDQLAIRFSRLHTRILQCAKT